MKYGWCAWHTRYSCVPSTQDINLTLRLLCAKHTNHALTCTTFVDAAFFNKSVVPRLKSVGQLCCFDVSVRQLCAWPFAGEIDFHFFIKYAWPAGVNDAANSAFVELRIDLMAPYVTSTQVILCTIPSYYHTHAAALHLCYSSLTMQTACKKPASSIQL